MQADCFIATSNFGEVINEIDPEYEQYLPEL